MANIRKSFNFRSGLQVDNDNFVINANGLVGIGTSVPQTYLLNVYGDTRTTGLTTTQDLFVTQNAEVIGVTTVGVLTASSIDIANGVNVGGALTAATLKLANGDTVDNLIGFARTTFITDNGGVGLHTTSKIGINTTTSPGASDSALEVFGDVKVTGIITATTFSGNVTGNVTGDLTGNVTGTATTATNLSDGANITTGTISDARLPDLITSNINTSSGVSTFTELKVGTAITMSAGIVTATTFVGNITGNVTGDLTGTINGVVNASSGVSTFTELKVGTAITMSAGIVTATTFDGALNATNLTGTINNDRLPVTPQFTSVGIGTASPTDALHIQQSGEAEIYVGSDSATSSLRVGRNLDANDSGMVKYGNTSGTYPYSTEKSLDFMNFGQGNVNFYIEAGIATSSSLNFNWIIGNNSSLMTLTDQGNLGIGITNPTHKLNVQGISTFTGSSYFNGSVTIDQNLTISGNLIFGSGAAITATLRGNVESADGSNTVVTVPTGSSDPVENAEVKARIVGGASTITKLDITGSGHSNPVFSVRASGVSADSVGSDIVINVNNAAANKFVVNSLGGVGIGTTNPVDSLDLKFAQRPAVFPNMTTAVISGLSTTGITTTSGSVVYNTTTNKLQVYNGTSWVDLH
jgi:hypothetical protein